MNEPRETSYDAIIKRLAQARKQAGLSQAQTARLMMVSPVTVSRWETGERDVALDTLLALCKIYGVSPAWVVGGMPLADEQRQEVVDALKRASNVAVEDAQHLLTLIDTLGRSDGEGGAE